MKDKLRDLAGEMRNELCSDFAQKLEAILDADGGGGAVAGTPERQLFDLAHAWGDNKIHNYTLMYRIEMIVEKLRKDNPARSGVVRDEDVEAACKIYVSNGGGSEVNHYVRVNMRAALEHFAKGERHER